MSVELKPCPFCGGEAMLSEDKRTDVYSVFCNECYVETSLQSTEQEAIEAWNRRVEPTFSPDEIDAIRRMFAYPAPLDNADVKKSIIEKCAKALKGGGVE